MVEAAFESAYFTGHGASSFGKNDQGIALAERLQEMVYGIVMRADFMAINQDRIEYVIGQIRPHLSFCPIIPRRNWPSEGAHFDRQGRPNDSGVEITGVVREIDPLVRIRNATGPAHVGSADELYHGYNKAGHFASMIWAIFRQRRNTVSKHPATTSVRAAGMTFEASGHRGANAASA